jgi:hypothetical protein
LKAERRSATVEHLLIDVSILRTDPHFIVFVLVIVLVRVVCGIVGLDLCQRRTDVAETHAVEAIMSRTERHLALNAAG